MNKCIFIICWFGKLPTYFDAWLKTVQYNSKFDFLILTDSLYEKKLPKNVYLREYSLLQFRERATEVLNSRVSIKKAYRVCDFRPMYGLIFQDFIFKYDFWGYCDIDLVFGNIASFVTDKMLNDYDAIFNAGHFTLIRNAEKTNTLFKQGGSLYSYQTVIKNDAVFAFDEFTGIQRIAHQTGLKAIYGIPFVDADAKYKQLTSRRAKTNPQNQAFYWEKGSLYRVQLHGNKISYQNIAYIHMQKRTIKNVEIHNESFWITPDGYYDKYYLGKPTEKDILIKNPFDGIQEQKSMKKKYKIRKIKELFSRTPLQILVRIKQAMYGINAMDSSLDDEWCEY